MPQQFPADEFITDAARWNAVTHRTAQADGAFFYGVTSTHIYCRAGCPARLPKRENVRFFDSVEAAEQRGYRACKRCRPDALHPQTDLAQRVCAYIDAHADQRVTLAMLADQMRLSPFHLQRMFKRAVGMTPSQYQRAQRLVHFKQSLQRGGNVTEAVYEAGFASSSRLYDSAAQLGMQPKSYRDKGARISIGFTLIDSPIGGILLAATQQGLCSVALGDDAAALEAALRAEFSAASIARDDAGLRHYADRLIDYLHGAAQVADLPLDVRATVFQRRVWELLRAIPYGQTRSYTDIAQQLGEPQAVRAVATACARNPVAIVIPCHRVVQKGGALAGYRWGLPRKAALLAAEKDEPADD